MKPVLLPIFVVTSLLPLAATANCWGIAEQTGEVLRQELRIESNNGPVTSVVSYRISVRQEVCESGGFVAFGTIDQRKCTSEGRGRKFIRQITLTTRDGKTITLGQTEKLVDGGAKIERNGPCTDHAKALTEEGNSSRIGTASTWAKDIAQDKDDVDATLNLIGRITDRKIVFTL